MHLTRTMTATYTFDVSSSLDGYAGVEPSGQASSKSARTAIDWLDAQQLREVLRYRPASHFWALQSLEAALLLALAGLLAGSRRRPLVGRPATRATMS
jgi:hypothetical protein